MFDFLKSLFESPKIEMSGKWHGIYGYDELIFPEQKPVRWSANIVCSSELKFKGTISEDENGVQEDSTIEGILKGKIIEFDKIYPSSHFLDEKGNHINRKGPMLINYSGSYDSAAKKFSGTWTIIAEYTSTNGTTSESITNGFWEMSRTKGYNGLDV